MNWNWMKTKMEITEEQINTWLDDEKKGFAEYSKAGLPNLAKDEAKHYNYLKKLKQQNYGN
jgi:hypothetical protein